MKLDEHFLQDIRLSPLLDSESILLFQLFVLEIDKRELQKKEYKIVYGYITQSVNENFEKKIYLSSKSGIFNEGNIFFSLSKVSIYGKSVEITNIINHLLGCKNLKDSISEEDYDTSLLTFDVSYIPNIQDIKEFIIRPIIFNETNKIVTRNFYERNSFHSPFKNSPSFSLIICRLNKIKILDNGNGQLYENWDNIILKILEYLEVNTKIFFKKSEYARLGNLEFINTHCSNKYGNEYAWFENIKEEVSISSSSTTISKKVNVVIEPNHLTENRRLLVNCYLTNGGQIILDECKEVFHEPGKRINISFESQEQLSQIAISIWREDEGKFQIWFKDISVIVRTFQFNMGLIGLSGVVKSEWLDILKNNKKLKTRVETAEKISRVSYNLSSVGDYKVDPWVPADDQFNDLIKQISPVNSEGKFFPKGWDQISNQHGGLSFLEWFQEITKEADKVFLQDPFFDTLGLEFITRTEKSDLDFNILTCTQIRSVDDQKTGWVRRSINNFVKRKQKVSHPNRANRLIKLMRSNPSLFQGLRLQIFDLRSKKGGEKAIIHDRYLLLFKKGNLEKGFHLSNSIQGATRNHPLLITPIPKEILKSVNDYVSQIVQGLSGVSETKIITLYPDLQEIKSEKQFKNIANTKLYTTLQKNTIVDGDVAKLNTEAFNIGKFITEVTKKQSNFPASWSTFGYYLAHSNYPEEALDLVINNSNDQFAGELLRFIKSSIQLKNPLGFEESKSSHGRNSFLHILAEKDFLESLKATISLENYLEPTPSSGNWGVYYGCEVLLKADIDKYFELIKFIYDKVIERWGKEDLSNSPLQKLTSIAINKFVKALFGSKDTTILYKSLGSSISSIRAIAVSAVISRTFDNSNQLGFDTAKDIIRANLTVDESLYSFCKWLLNLERHKGNVDPRIEKALLASLSTILAVNYSEKRLSNMFEQLLYTGYPLIEKKITEQILYDLLENQIIDSNYFLEFWSKEFFLSIQKESIQIAKISGIIDMTGWSFCVADIEGREKLIKKVQAEINKCERNIRAPFSKGSTSWQESFNKLFLLKTMLTVILLYNKENSQKIDTHVHLSDICKEIDDYIINYQPTFFDNSIRSYCESITNRYKEVT